MIVAAALSALAWLVFGAVGVPVDPFLPLAAALALGPRWPVGWRALAVVGLAPLAAVACADDTGERTAVYALAALLAVQGERFLRDGVGARTALVLAALGTVVGVRLVLSVFGGEAPVQGATTLGLTLLWTASHAALSGWLGTKR